MGQANNLSCCASCTPESELKINMDVEQVKTINRQSEGSMTDLRVNKQPAVLVQNVHTGSHHDLRWQVDRA